MVSNGDKAQAMEEGKAVTKKTDLATQNKKKVVLRGAVGVGLLVTAILVVALPLSLQKRSSSKLSSDLANGNGTLPALSLGTLKETYSSCVALESDLETAARMIAEQTIESNVEIHFRNGDIERFSGERTPVEWVTTFTGQPVDVTTTVAGVAEPPSAVAAGGGADITTDESSFESNNQEAGVQEPDAVKSDGVSVFAAYGTEIVKLSVAENAVESRTQLPTESEKCHLYRVSNMLLVDDTLIAISSGWCDEEETTASDTVFTTGFIAFSPYVSPRSTFTRILIFDKNTMALKEEPRQIKGTYNSARAIDGDLYIVTSRSVGYNSWLASKLNIWDSKIFGKNFTEAHYRETASTEVEQHISAFISELVESFENCGSVHRLALFQNEAADTLPAYLQLMESISTVTSFHIDTPDNVSSKNMLLPYPGWEVYSSTTQLVLAGKGWHVLDGVSSQQTYVITYKLADAQASVIGFGSVPGYVLNQYSIDHQSKNGKDYLLFATTTHQRWAAPPSVFAEGGLVRTSVWRPISETTSQITVLEVPSDETLVDEMSVVGRVEGLGKPGEQIFSVRFLEDKAFVVTFERTDPFYTIDITDPENPHQVGELEIPGFSSYLHPIGENLIMGVGQNVNERTGRQEGLQISIFDIQDFANPQRIHTFTEESGDGSRSEAEYNPMAFRYLDDTGLLILPLSVYNWAQDPADDEKPFNGFRVYKADENGIVEYLSVNHETRDYYFHRNCQRNGVGSLAGRALVFSGVLWTMQGNTVEFSDLSTRVTSTEPIDLDEGNDDAVHCASTLGLVPQLFPVAGFPLSAPVVTNGDEVDNEPDCSDVSCDVPDCGDGTPFTPDGECCEVCSSTTRPPGCNDDFCVGVVCDTELLVYVDGSCCPSCP